jgi:hypothetical protein
MSLVDTHTALFTPHTSSHVLVGALFLSGSGAGIVTHWSCGILPVAAAFDDGAAMQPLERMVANAKIEINWHARIENLYTNS